MKRRFKKRERKEALDIDITSLLDILVILLVFLLKSYNPSDLKLDLAKGVELPDSKSLSFGSRSVMVQVNVDREIFVNETKIGEFSSQGEKIDILFEELTKIKKEEQSRNLAQDDSLTEAQKKQLDEKKQNINIVLDQSLPYSVLQKVMHTAAVAGYPKFKFIVQGRYQ